MTPVLTVQTARKAFGATQALDDAHLELRRGEWLGLLGPNGAGKTTLVRSISGRVRLDDGRITLLGHSLNGPDAAAARARARLGVVPQEVALYPLLTARENLDAFASCHGLERAARSEKIDWALQWTGLADRADEPTNRFSGGMKRRLNIACSVLHGPEVVLLDEPTVGVDPQSRQRIWEMLDQLRRDGASLLQTTHQLDEAQQVCDRIVIIDHGRAIAEGTFDELVQQTIGPKRRVSVTLGGDIPPALHEAGFTVENGAIGAQVEDLADELPGLLARIRAAGVTIADIHFQSPTLQAVFIHLTGRELRE